MTASDDMRVRELTERIVHTCHVVNNLLTGILGQAQLMLIREDIEPNLRQRAQTIEDLAKRIKSAVADLNDV